MNNADHQPLAWKRYEQMRPRTEVDIDPRQLDAYVGHFAFADGLVAEISVRDEQLHLHLVGQTPVPLFAEAPDAFFLKIIPAQVTFGRVETEVHTLVLHQHGHEHLAERCDAQRFIDAERARKAHAARIEPLADSEPKLRAMLTAQRAGTPDYAEMTEDLAALVREQLPVAQAELTRLDAIEAMTFRRASEAGFDLFDVRFTNGSMEAGISFAGDGRVNGLFLRP